MIIPPALGYSPNWVGYGWPSSVKSAAEWVVPEFPWKEPLSASEEADHNGLAIWAGIGGSGSSNIEQIGIYDNVTAGAVGWYGLYEFYPYPSVGIPAADQISPGDEIFANVSRDGVNYTMSLHDAGPHHVWTFTITAAFGHIEPEAEVITEDYVYPGYSLSDLTPFSPVTANVSGDPSDEFYSDWGYAIKDSDSQVTMNSNG